MGILKKLFNSSKPTYRPSSNAKDIPPQSANRNHNACPHCGAIQSPAPKRKKACPDCKQDIYVRTKQQLFNSDLLKEEDALASDFYDELIHLGATIEDYKNVESELTKKWGSKPNSYDVVWGVSNRLVASPVDQNEYDKTQAMLHRAKMISFAQASYQIKRGVDPTSYKRSVNNYDIQLAKHSGLPIRHFVIETRDCCSQCNKYQGKEYTAEQLEKNPILPIEECTRKLEGYEKFHWCTCWYSPVH